MAVPNWLVLVLVFSAFMLLVQVVKSPPSPQPPPKPTPEFRYVINSEKCLPGRPTFAVILINTQPQHQALRSVIRTIWSNLQILGFPIRILFSFGLMSDRRMQQVLEHESTYHGDILQGNFVDGSQNLALKDMMALRWAWQRCPQAKYIIHVDDSTSLNIFELVGILQRDFKKNPDFVACIYIWKDTKVLREGPHAVDKLEHPKDTFDDYCSGWLYVTTPVTARALDDAAVTEPSFRISDAYITGTLVKATNRTHHKITLKWTIDIEDMRRMVDHWGKDEMTVPPFGIGPNDRNISLCLMLHARFQAYAILTSIQRSQSQSMPIISSPTPIPPTTPTTENPVENEVAIYTGFGRPWTQEPRF